MASREHALVYFLLGSALSPRTVGDFRKQEFYEYLNVEEANRRNYVELHH